MANPNKAFLTGTTKVLDYFDNNAKTAYWSVMDAKNMVIFANADDDLHESRQKLEDNILAAEAAGMTATLCLRLHPKKPKDGFYDSKTPTMMGTYFRPCEYETQPYNGMMANQMAGNAMLAQQLSAIESRLNAMQMKLDAEEEEDEEEEDEEMGFLSGLMGNPAIKQMVVNVISNLMTPAKGANVSQVAGIDQAQPEIEEEYTEQDAKIDEAIERLKVHDPNLGDDLLKLCQIAETDPNQFKMLLKMLRM